MAVVIDYKAAKSALGLDWETVKISKRTKVVRINLFTLWQTAIRTKPIRFSSRTNLVRIDVQIFVRLEQVQCKRKADPNNL